MEDVVNGRRRDANDLDNDDLKNLLSRCANCNLELINEVATIAEIYGKYPTSANVDRQDMLHCKTKNDNVGLSRCSSVEPVTTTHKVNGSEISTTQQAQEEEGIGYAVTVLEAMSNIYGFPLEKSRKRDERMRMWRKEDECGLCKQCAKIVTMFYHAYQELKMLAHEASYISKGLEQLRKCVQKTFSDCDDEAEEANRKVKRQNSNNKKKTFGNGRQNSDNDKPAISSCESPSKTPENDKTELKQVQPRQNDKTEELFRSRNIDETPFELEIVKVETLLSEQCERDTNVKKSKKVAVEIPSTQEEETEIGTREMVSADGRLIRSSTRTRKIKTPIDFGSSPSSTRRNSLLIKDACGRRRSTRIGENIEQQKSIIKEQTTSSTSTNVPNTNDDMDSVLWEFCNDIYYKDTNLATLKDGRFIGPDSKCGKTFKGLKTLNKHSLVHDLNRTYQCSKCDKVFMNRQEIKLHVQQSHIQTEMSSNPNKYSKECLLNSNQNTSAQSTSASSKQFRRKDEKSLKILEKVNKASSQAEKQFQCEHCDKIYISKRMYEKHLTFHNKQGVMCRCTICDQNFHTALNLARHITSVHDANDESLLLDYSCPQCPLSVSSFENYSELKVHFEKTHKNSLNFCKKCGKCFTTSHHLRRHHQNVHKEQMTDISETSGENKNAVKQEEFGEDWNENTLNDSFDKDLEPGEMKRKDAKTSDTTNSNNLFNCIKCNKKFKRKHQLNVHILFHNETVPRFGCSKCPKKFFQPNSLRTHMLVHSMKNPLLCKKCDKVFERRDHFKRHMEMVHNKNRIKKARNTAHTCSDCKKTFSRKEYLRLHMRIHTGEKPHVCEVCGKQFRDPRNLVQHLVTHNTERPFCCSVCGLTFKRAHHLNDHEGTHRQNIVRPFVCPVAYCGKAFKLRKHLVSHELVHLGSKDHTCHVCGRAFSSRKDNLRQHINKIHGKKLADELLIVVQEQRERHRQTQQKQQGSALNVEYAENSEECILEQDTILADTTLATAFSASLEQETAVMGASSNFIGENGQMSQVLQIPTDVVTTTIAVPLSSIVATLVPTNSFPNFSYL